MKKIIELVDNNDFYILKNAEDEILKISKKIMKISGRDLYENYFASINIEEFLEIEIKNKCSSTEKITGIVFARLKEIFIEIATKINSEFEKERKDIVVASEITDTILVPQK